MADKTEEEPNVSRERVYETPETPTVLDQEIGISTAELKLLDIKQKILRKKDDIKRTKSYASKPWYVNSVLFVWESVLVPAAACLIVGFAGGCGAYMGFLYINWYVGNY